MDFLGTVKKYSITNELIRRYMNIYFPDINSIYKLKKRFNEINNAIRFKYFISYKWNK